MKRISIYVMSLLLSGLFLVACEKDDNATLSFDKNSVEVLIGQSDVVKVSGGEAPYKAVSADATIAEATVEGSNISVKGLKEGNTTVKVTDKNGVEKLLPVAVKKDPFEDQKADATVRVKWDTVEKTDGTGLFTLTKAGDKTVTFAWENEEEEESLVLTFKDPADIIGGEKTDEGGEAGALARMALPKAVGALTVVAEGDTTNYDVASWRLVQAKPADDQEGTPDSYWVAFTADSKEGLFVAPLTETEEPAEE